MHGESPWSHIKAGAISHTMRFVHLAHCGHWARPVCLATPVSPIQHSSGNTTATDLSHLANHNI